MIDPKNFDIFLESPFAKYLLEGIQDEKKVEEKGITKVSQFIRSQNSYSKAMRRAKFEATMQVNRNKENKERPQSKTRRASESYQMMNNVKPAPKQVGRTEYYRQFFSMVKENNIQPEEKLRADKIVKQELARMQKMMQSKSRPKTFAQIINQLQEQGPLEKEVCDPKLREKVHQVVLEVLRTMFTWFGLPWRELTNENMFDKANLLKAVDKHAIRFSKFAKFDVNAMQESARGIDIFTNKMHERLMKMGNRNKDANIGKGKTSDPQARRALEDEVMHRRKTKLMQQNSPERLS